MAKDKLRDLEQKSIPRLILSYSVTTFAALALNGVYTLTDAIFIGRGIGADALGGIAAVLPFIMLQGAVSSMTGGGAAILVSQLLGKNDKKKAGETVFAAATAFWVASLLITALGLIFIDPLLNALGVADNLKAYAEPYLRILLIGTVFSTGFSAVMRAEGKMLYALLQWVIPVSINIVLDGVLIFGFNMGAESAAYATLGCYIATFITALLFFTRFSFLDFKNVRFKVKTLGGVLTVGLPSLVQMGSIAAGMALLNNALRTIGGGEPQITYGIIGKIFMFCIVPLTAITQVLQPIAGYNHGAGKPERIKTAMKYTVLFSLAAAALPLIICELAPRLLISIFTSDSALIDVAAPALRQVAAAFPFMFLPSAVGMLLQSTGKKLMAALLFASSFIFVPPFALLLGAAKGAAYIWLSFPIACATASAIAAAVLFVFFKKYDKIFKPLKIDLENNR
ncbi:MAG: hypothetical protein LBQ40_07580 [Clostridiales bacterium]|jgi:putative MATE family efflux protein|nr:hypothetical protein [Clostridiales bacterium]